MMANAIVYNSMIPIRALVREYKFEEEAQKQPTLESIEPNSLMDISMSENNLQECDSESLHNLLIAAAKKKEATTVVSLLSHAARFGIIVDVKEVVRKSIPASEWNCSFMHDKKMHCHSSVLRLLLLHGAIPALSNYSMLDGYSPSPWLAQTFAKGWP